MADSYHLSHRAPGPEDDGSTVRLDQVGSQYDDVFPADAMRYPARYGATNSEVTTTTRSAQGNPDARVRVYRAVPPHVTTINPGDWVALSKQHATDEAQMEGATVISALAKASDLWSEGLLDEWGYNGQQPLTSDTPTTTARDKSLATGQEQFTSQQLAGLAIETVTKARAALHYNDTQTVRDMLNQASDTITTFTHNQAPQNSADLSAVFTSLIVRETLPYGTPQHSTSDIIQRLNSAGFTTPELTIEDTLSAHQIQPLTRATLEQHLGPQLPPTTQEPPQEAQQNTPADITIYTTPNCMGCAATKRQFDKMGIDYLVIDLSERPDLVENFKAQGLAQAPIVQTATDTWSGMRPDKIKEASRDYQARTRTTDNPHTGYER